MHRKKKKTSHAKVIEKTAAKKTVGQPVETTEREETAESQDTGAVPDETGGVSPETKETETVSGKEAVELSPEEKLAVLNDKYLRLMAEYDNYRKRTIKEKSEIIKTAAEGLIIELLPILDNLDRATEHRNDKTTYEEYVKGIAIIEDQIRDVLSRAGLETMDVSGKPFDPAVHDAVMQVETENYESGVISEEVEKGYILSGKVIRHPKVIVSK